MFHLLVGGCEFGGQLLPQLLQLLQQQRLLLLQTDPFPLKLLLQLLRTTRKNKTRKSKPTISRSGGSGDASAYKPRVFTESGLEVRIHGWLCNTVLVISTSKAFIRCKSPLLCVYRTTEALILILK